MHTCVILFSDPGDYVHIIKQPLTFGPGTTSQQVIAVIVNDDSAEAQEQFKPVCLSTKSHIQESP